MSTGNNNIASLESVAGELTDIIKTNSLAYQICGVQHSETPNPLVFGVKKNELTKGFEIVKKVPEKLTSSDSEGFTEEVIDDVNALFGPDAKDYLKVIAANEICNSIDSTIITYMQGIATAVTPVTYDFAAVTNHKQIIHNLLLKINKTRVEMNTELKRGLPKILIVSGGIASLLITNKMVSGNDSDFVAGGRENIKFVGKMGDMQVYHDFDAASDYVMIAHKTMIMGDASVILVPISEPRFDVRRGSETGQQKFHFKQRHAYSRNPLDADNVGDSLFIKSIAVTLSNY
jgi:hypothetical protein